MISEDYVEYIEEKNRELNSKIFDLRKLLKLDEFIFQYLIDMSTQQEKIHEEEIRDAAETIVFRDDQLKTIDKLLEEWYMYTRDDLVKKIRLILKKKGEK